VTAVTRQWIARHLAEHLGEIIGWLTGKRNWRFIDFILIVITPICIHYFYNKKAFVPPDTASTWPALTYSVGFRYDS